MKRVLVFLFAFFVSFGVMSVEVEAKRFGGGKSSGMQRSAPQRQADQPMQRQQQGQQAAPAQKRSWMGPLAGLAAGIGLAALFSHLGMGEGMANFAMMALLAVGAFFLIRFVMARMRPAAAAPAQYAPAGAGNAPVAPADYRQQDYRQQYGSVNDTGAFSADALTAFPPELDVEAFVRVAKVNFVRLQAAYDAADLDDLREFTSPEMFAEIKMQLAERGSSANVTDVVQLDAELVDYARESNREIASVRFHGLIRESADASAERFEETWHLSKSGKSGWVVAGIQQAA
ncbi:Tim44 domain-containing protein [Chitinimonas sp. BJYL2]|uniref:Tim44 domain-containing protein n=1 Tax=Chitinimonas sp. BJYL2 TaxID=2976696 RepID=UPI0022B2EEFA|nr:Tim44-like domain-containing protein [Chitinimonas sp. BJYL2]